MAIQEETSKIKITRIVSWIIISVTFFALLYWLRTILRPFAIALIFWFIIDTLLSLIRKIKIGKQRIPYWVSAVISFFLVLGIISGITELLILNVNQINNQAAKYENQANRYINELEAFLGIQNIFESITKEFKIGDLSSIASSVLSGLTNFIGNMVLIIVYIIFLLIEQRVFNKKLEGFITKNNQQDFTDVFDKIRFAVKRYLTTKTLTNLITAVLCFIVLILMKVDFPFLWAFFIFLGNYIPYVGSFVAVFLPSLFAMFQYEDPLKFLWVFLATEAMVALVANYIEPRMMGRYLNLSPLVIIFSLVFGGFIWGVLGMILSVPVMSVMMIILAQFPNTLPLAILLSEKGEISSLLVDRQ